jgi:hypothetical protein
MNNARDPPPSSLDIFDQVKHVGEPSLNLMEKVPPAVMRAK